MPQYIVTLRNGEIFEAASVELPVVGDDGLYEFRVDHNYRWIPAEKVVSVELRPIGQPIPEK